MCSSEECQVHIHEWVFGQFTCWGVRMFRYRVLLQVNVSRQVAETFVFIIDFDFWFDLIFVVLHYTRCVDFVCHEQLEDMYSTWRIFFKLYFLQFTADMNVLCCSKSKNNLVLLLLFFFPSQLVSLLFCCLRTQRAHLQNS